MPEMITVPPRIGLIPCGVTVMILVVPACPHRTACSGGCEGRNLRGRTLLQQIHHRSGAVPAAGRYVRQRHVGLHNYLRRSAGVHGNRSNHARRQLPRQEARPAVFPIQVRIHIHDEGYVRIRIHHYSQMCGGVDAKRDRPQEAPSRLAAQAKSANQRIVKVFAARSGAGRSVQGIEI